MRVRVDVGRGTGSAGIPQGYLCQSLKHITPDQATTILYEKWKAALPLLVDEILAYTTSSVGAAIQPVASELQGICSPVSYSSDLKTTKVTCLYFDRTFNQLLLSTGNSDMSLS